MAAKKKKAKKPARRRVRYQYRMRRFRSPEERRWDLWSHDVDTLLHQMVKNPAYHDIEASELVAKAEAFADAYHAMQDRRRPPGLEDG